MKNTNQAMHPLNDVSADDAIGMLIADHKRVANLFADFKRLTEEGSDAQKAAVVQQICRELTLHAQLEEDLFYPATRGVIEDDDQVDEAVVEHASAKELIAQLEVASPGDELYDARVTVLGEQIDHHVDEEEGSLFPKVRHSGLDTFTLGAAMLKRKSELLGGEPTLMPKTRAAAFEGVENDEGDTDTVAQKPRALLNKKASRARSATRPSAKKRRRQ